MINVKAKVRVWGRSLGIVIPIGAVKSGHIKEGDTIDLLFKKEEENPLKKTFGTFKFKRSTEEILKEVDEESWDE